jgi:hypothetical protein
MIDFYLLLKRSGESVEGAKLLFITLFMLAVFTELLLFRRKGYCIS